MHGSAPEENVIILLLWTSARLRPSKADIHLWHIGRRQRWLWAVVPRSDTSDWQPRA